MSMKAEIRHIQAYVKQHEGSEQTTVDLISKYFDEQVTWSLEKEEWTKMSTEQRQAFADELNKPKSTPAKRVAAIVKVAKKQTKVAKKVPLKLTKPASKNGKPASKMSKAREIYKSMKNKPRQEILAAFIKMGLTKAGAATYLQLIRSKG